MTTHYRAIAFDTGGTVLDWHATMVDEVRQVQAWQGCAFDAHIFVNDWRRRTMKRIVGQVQPAFDMDDVHLQTLDETALAHGLPALAPDARHRLWRGWHRLRAWPDFPSALNALRQALPVVSFTMLPLPLVIDVSRLNGLVWDAVVSCQMIGTYKPHAQAYQRACAWIGCAPGEVLMVACHNFDLQAAQDVGMATAFVRRPLEWGPSGPPDRHTSRRYDHVVDTFDELVAAVLGPAGGDVSSA
jgi:2-haloacid dehalogenase